jgi:hypothetical protein
MLAAKVDNLNRGVSAGFELLSVVCGRGRFTQSCEALVYGSVSLFFVGSSSNIALLAVPASSFGKQLAGIQCFIMFI